MLIMVLNASSYSGDSQICTPSLHSSKEFHVYIPNCLMDIPTWMAHRHFNCNMLETGLLTFPHRPTLILLKSYHLSNSILLLNSCSNQNLRIFPAFFLHALLLIMQWSSWSNLHNISKTHTLLLTLSTPTLLLPLPFPYCCPYLATIHSQHSSPRDPFLQ